MRSSGELVERFELQRPTSSRNEAGENVPGWEKVRDLLGSYEATSYAEASRRGQIGGNRMATVFVRWVDGVDGSMRLVWRSNGDRILMISSAVPIGRREDLELTVEESVA